MSADLDKWIGKTDVKMDIVTTALLDRYRAVIGTKASDDKIPHGLHWCLCLPRAPMAELGLDGHPKKGGFLPPSTLPRRMWASSQVEFVNDINVGATIERRSTIASVSEKTGQSGPLLFVNIEHDVLANGVSAIKEMQTIVYKDQPKEQLPLPEAIDVDLSDWDVTERLSPNNALLFRYSALTFNAHRIHYDFEYTRQIEGYPALVVHGPLMASLLLRFASEQALGGALAKFEFRGLAPAYCNQDLIMAANHLDGGMELAIIGVDGKKRMSAKVSFKAD